MIEFNELSSYSSSKDCRLQNSHRISQEKSKETSQEIASRTVTQLVAVGASPLCKRMLKTPVGIAREAEWAGSTGDIVSTNLPGKQYARSRGPTTEGMLERLIGGRKRRCDKH